MMLWIKMEPVGSGALRTVALNVRHFQKKVTTRSKCSKQTDERGNRVGQMFKYMKSAHHIGTPRYERCLLHRPCNDPCP